MSLPDKDTLISALISVAAHMFFLAAAAFVCLGGTAPLPEKAPQPVHVTIASDKPLRRLPVSRAGSDGPVTGVPGYGGQVSDTLATGIDDPLGKGLARQDEFTELLVRGKMEESRALPDKRAADRTQQAVTKRLVRDDIVSADGTLPVPSQEEFEAVPEEQDLPKEFIKEMPGFTPVASATKADTVSYKPLRGAGGKGALGGGGGGGGTGIDEYLLADLVVYKDPADGQKYFKITVMAGKEVDRFTVMPKDITFLIDCSLSIQSDLAGFKRGLRYCLDHLGKDDTFNLIRFDASSKALSEAQLGVTPESIAAGRTFVDKLLPSSITDLYGALTRVMARPTDRRPSYIVLLSDGRPTAGLKNSREIIGKILAADKGTRPVFAFSGVGRANRYLLDFLTFCNRGWAEYAGQPSPMEGELSTFYDKIKDPILLAPRYRFSGVSTDETYPKNLSDFFRGVSFVIYGRYDAENEFSMQLVGEGAHEKLEFIFADSFKNARQGSPDIARQWAYNKIYYLISTLVEKGPDPVVAGQIRELYKKFDIQTPYDEGVK